MPGKHAAHALAFVLIGLLLATCASVAISGSSEAATDQPPKGWNWFCTSAGRDYIDPIVSPGVYPTGHKHDFFGARPKPTTINALRLRQIPNDCAWAHNDTDEGDRSSYWEPVPYDKLTGAEIRTSQVNNYYRLGKGTSPDEVKPFPDGLKYVIGSPTATGEQEHIVWRCADQEGSGQGTPIDCSDGNNVKLTYFLPSCSDGRKDSPDHKSHMAYPTRDGCPASHPRAVPALNMSFGIKTEDGTRIEFRGHEGEVVAPHADFFNGTPHEVYSGWIDACIDSPVGGCAGTGIPGQKNP